MKVLEAINKNRKLLLYLAAIIIAIILLYMVYNKFLSPGAGSSTSQSNDVSKLKANKNNFTHDPAYYATLADSMYTILDSSLYISDNEMQTGIVDPLNALNNDEIAQVFKDFDVRHRTHFGIKWGDDMNLRAFCAYSLSSDMNAKVDKILTRAGL